MDPTGGLDLTIDDVTAGPPDNPDYREGTSMWLWDDAGRVALPRVALESVGATWDTARMATVNLALPDGQVYVAWDDVAPHPVTGGAGQPTVLGAGPMRFECVERFVHWRFSFDGKAAPTTVQDQIDGRAPQDIPAASTVALVVEIDTHMVTPPWVQGSLGGEGFVPGEHRFEQLFTASGRVALGGQEIAFAGGGLRIHRKGGIRTDPSDFFGHAWQSARFPSGRAFGYIHYYPRLDGTPKFVEGWVMDHDGEVLAAQVIETPWMRNMVPKGDDVAVTFRTARGDVHIGGETVLSTFHPERLIRPDITFPALQQGIARYRWQDEECLGMIERSIPRR